MADVKLAEATGDEVPRPFRWALADAATREAINVAGTNADDIGCLAWQQDDESVWIAIAAGTGPSKWSVIGVGTLAQTLAKGNTTGANDVVVSDGRFIALGTTNPAGTGQLRLRANQGGVQWRNAGNSTDLGIDADAAETALNFQIGGETFIQIGAIATTAIIGGYADVATGGFVISCNPPTTGVAGVPIVILGCAGGTGSQDGGDVIFVPGNGTSAGNDGTLGFQDTDGNWRLKLTPSQELEYNAETQHQFQIAGVPIAYISENAGEGVIVFDKTVTSAVVTVAPPTTAVAGRSLGLIGGTGGTGAQDGGAAFVRAGLATDSGVPGEARLETQDSVGVVIVSGSTGAEVLTLDPEYIDVLDNASGTPVAPTGAFRMWSDGGAGKGRSAGGTITAFIPA